MSGNDAFDLFTVGHSNHPIEHFLRLLGAAGVTCVADVRSVPFSRRFPWFSSGALAGHLQGAGIAYQAYGHSLGGRPDDPALFCEGVADYEAIAATPSFQAGLDVVMAEAREQRVCLMCAEREPLDCHRCLLVARALAAKGRRIGHILADGSVEPHEATEERLITLTGAAPDLFAPDRRATLAEAYRKRARTAAYRNT